MKLKLNVEELISSIKKEALDSGVYRDAMEKTFDSLREIVREIENPYPLICKGKWDVCEYLMSLVKSMERNYTDMFLICDVIIEAEPGSHCEILWNHDGANWYYHVDPRDPRHYERKFIVDFYEERGDSVPYLYEEV